MNAVDQPSGNRGAASTLRAVSLLKSFLGSLVLAGFALYLWLHRYKLAAVLDVRAIDLGLISALTLASWMVVAVQNYLLYRAMGVRFRLAESWLITAASGFGNYLPLRPGTLLRAHYLKRVRGLRYAHFGSIFVVRSVLFAVATGVTGLISTWWIACDRGRVSIELILVFSLLSTVPFLALYWTPRFGSRDFPKLGQWIDALRDGITHLRALPATSALVAALVLVQFLLLGLRFWIASDAVNAGLTAPAYVLLAAVGTLVGFVAITPGALGVREALMGYVTFAVGESFSRGVYVGVVDRAVTLALTATIGAASFVVVWRRIRKAESVFSASRASPETEIPFSSPD
jgi:uncharacterized membrane protein YbhN (UPF0104 family)